MKFAAIVAIVWIFVHVSLSEQSGLPDDLQQRSEISAKALNGEFVGMEEIKNYEPGQQWFHENSLVIRDNEAVLDKVPLKIVKGSKQYSASVDSDFPRQSLSSRTMVRRAIVAGVVDEVKTKYSRAGLPLDPALAELLWSWKAKNTVPSRFRLGLCQSIAKWGMALSRLGYPAAEN